MFFKENFLQAFILASTLGPTVTSALLNPTTGTPNITCWISFSPFPLDTATCDTGKRLWFCQLSTCRMGFKKPSRENSYKDLLIFYDCKATHYPFNHIDKVLAQSYEVNRDSRITIVDGIDYATKKSLPHAEFTCVLNGINNPRTTCDNCNVDRNDPPPEKA
ncbi:hypothetical protein O181_039056 [Austropuccinia psidii MF-1]|uniref:Secreted protein n=1 Tax=Austropuccinia psidii MF-1 TaxID=1389203 RepID=A0A9Q3DF65_9BASI|nr:hypothetical protein [Austropuccinia psidii MF-1]